MKNEESYKIIDLKTKFLKIIYILSNTFKVISGLIINIILIYCFVNAIDLMTRIIITPFLICALTLLVQIIANLLHKQKYIKIFNKIYMLSFLLYWFGFLILMSYSSIKDNQISILLFSIPFWIIGIYMFYNTILKR